MVLRKKEDTDNMQISELKHYKLRMQIIRYLYKKSPQPASYLSKKTHVSLPTVRAVLDELITEKIICITGIGPSKGGRRPILYSLLSEAYYIMAVEVGHHRAKASLFNCHNKEVTEIHEYTTNIDDPHFLEHTKAVFDQLLVQSGLKQSQIVALGVSMPGLIDSVNGINKTIKDPKAQAVKARLSKHFNIPIYIENDARMQALGESVFGKAQKTKNTLVLNWHWGLGLGMILDGQIYQGANGSAGEFSHLRIIPQGKLCSCGKQGCLQTIASTQTLLDMAKAEIAKKTPSQLTSSYASKPEELDVTAITNYAKRGDELSISLLHQLSSNLAWGLSILIELYNPELIVLNGPVTQAGKYILIPIQQALNQYCLDNIIENIRIEISELGEHSGLKGVAVMVFQKLFRDKSTDSHY
ncbi:ROK family protein [uncultured Sunxiuqinia sp.]|uniref:ROK family protein n=1 Tax=uncultured Sunxiuqinia sp. TaxID=1573825 RepID=UPI0026168ACF|nr:ROK family protein [uncultured Sunxiuqinia sp.]